MNKIRRFILRLIGVDKDMLQLAVSDIVKKQLKFSDLETWIRDEVNNQVDSYLLDSADNTSDGLTREALIKLIQDNVHIDITPKRRKTLQIDDKLAYKLFALQEEAKTNSKAIRKLSNFMKENALKLNV